MADISESELAKIQSQGEETQESNRRWKTNLEKHPWLRDPPECLKVKERTENMGKRIKQLEEDDEIYMMKEGGRKMCLIIGNTKCKSYEELMGCAKDNAYLSALFKQLNFEVTVKNNLTAKEMTAFLNEKKENLKDVECFVCAITSHGNHTGILGTDEEVTSFLDIMKMFDRDNCRELSNKPKLFFFDVCRGRHEDVPKNPTVVNESTDAMIPPIKSDILVAHATSHDYVSFCHPEYGSWFCRSFVKVVSENACRYNILDMLLKVNRKVGEFQSAKGSLQSAQFDSSMRKQFFFSQPVIPERLQIKMLSNLREKRGTKRKPDSKIFEVSIIFILRKLKTLITHKLYGIMYA
ncbi:caspase-3-like isoform X2 [Mercenaria mercenaria]|uniref:caspase-3-like isoform X2 n=1 Tax=Mercenaria mercenaria TaxID=6596 RepID=UPI00234F1F73|nr:caspase-3-like isoform X2 [Mercenaria mercenaria]